MRFYVENSSRDTSSPAKSHSAAIYIVDFYCSKLQLVIEIDGDSHVENKEYDETRTEVLSQLGLRVLRYTNRDVCNNIEGVYQDLMHIIEPPCPPCQRGKEGKSP
jgi:very-short-patch-repair endonuclease